MCEAACLKKKRKRNITGANCSFAACRPAPAWPTPQRLSPLTQPHCSDRTVVRLNPAVPAATGRFTTAIRAFTSSVFHLCSGYFACGRVKLSRSLLLPGHVFYSASHGKEEPGCKSNGFNVVARWNELKCVYIY